MKIELMIKQDDYTHKTISLSELWKLLKSYLSQGYRLWITIDHNDPNKKDTEIRVLKR